jgi:hypothetical protein
MDEYIRANNDFCQRREEAYRYFEMTRGFGGRLHPSSEQSPQLTVFGHATNFLQTTSSERQRGEKLQWRKVR